MVPCANSWRAYQQQGSRRKPSSTWLLPRSMSEATKTTRDRKQRGGTLHLLVALVAGTG